VVCRCECITAGELREAVDYGGAEANRVKSLSPSAWAGVRAATASSPKPSSSPRASDALRRMSADCGARLRSAPRPSAP
jgi:hypothetical protein